MKKAVFRSFSFSLAILMSLSIMGCQKKETDQATAATQTTAAQEESTTSAEQESAEETASAVVEENVETYVFTDSSGREVEIPKNIQRVASGGPLANIMLYAVKPEVIVGWSSRPSDSAKKYIDEKYWNLPEYGKFFGNKSDFNREALMESNPDIVIDVGEWDEEYKNDLDTLQEQIGIPVIIVDGNLENTAQAYRTIGKLLDREEESEKMAAYCDEVIADAAEKAATIPEADRKSVYYAEGDAGLSTIVKNSIHSQIYDLVGANIVVGEDNVTAERGGGTVSMEQVMAWNPDVIMFASGSIYDTVKGNPTWEALTAIQNGTYYEIPNEPYHWLGRPPGPNRIIGVRWLGNLLYPDVFDYDIKQEVKDYFSLFYRYDLTDEEVNGLLANSTLKSEPN